MEMGVQHWEMMKYEGHGRIISSFYNTDTQEQNCSPHV